MNTPSLSKRKNSRRRDSSGNQSHEANNGDINNGSVEPMSADTENLDSSRKNSCKSSSRKRKKVYKKKKVYPLRSSTDGARNLRSRSNSKSSASNGSASAPGIPVPKVRRKRKHMKNTSDDELSRTRKRVRYLLARMQYEQSLLDAYSGEGWKGQSSEKIRPEKELERAKSEILRCKLKIRDLFQHLDSLGMEGKLDESLFDSEGEISSEDILCANCSSKELSADNDIILCDGSCDRGFHQKCLNPPLLNEDIPPGDVGWLCPVCDCKVDCINFLNELEGLDLSVEDTWEEVFPEAAAIANGDRKYDDLGLPSDDSEDDDFNPDAPDIDLENRKEDSGSGESSSGESYYTCSSEHSDVEASNPDKHSNTVGLPSDDSDDDDDDDYDPDGLDPEKVVQKDESSLEGSDFTSDSDDFMEEIKKAEHSDAGALNHDNHSNTLGLPSDDSDDDDYDPDGPDPEKIVQMDGSSLEGSDFTSDSDDFMEEITKASDTNEVSSSLKRKPLDLSGEHTNSNVSKKSIKNPELRSILEPDMNGESVQLVSGKRQRENLDYKKLYDEEYGDASSDSSDEDDVDWSGKSSVKKAKKVETKEGSSASPKANATTASKGKLKEVNSSGVHFDQSPVPRIVNGRRKTLKKSESSAASPSTTVKSCDSPELDSSGNKSSAREKLGTMATQRLLQAFVDNQYPDRKTKESLAEEIGKTLKQVSKWFGNARHSARAVAQESGQAGSATPAKSVGTSKTNTSSEEAGRAGFSTPTKSITVTDSATTPSRTRRSGEALNHAEASNGKKAKTPPVERCGEALNHAEASNGKKVKTPPVEASNGKKAKTPPADRRQKKAGGQVGRKRKKSR